MTKILFDAMSLDGKPSGTRTRLIGLVPELARRGHIVTVAHGPRLDTSARSIMAGATLHEVAAPPGPGPARRLASQGRVYRQILTDVTPDAVISETWPMPRTAGLMPVVHDLRYLGLARPQRSVFEVFLRDACRRAARIQAVSAAVAHELTDHLHIDIDRIDVVPAGIPLPDPARLTAGDASAEGRYVVVVAHDEPRKDFPFVAQMAARLTADGIEVVQAGRRPHEGVSRGYRAGGPTGTSAAGADGAQAGPVSSLGIVSDDSRDTLFRNAVALLAPSRYEGFGLVPLEGLAAGAWVVASAIAAHREVLGGAASFFAPGDLDAAAIHILEAEGAGEGARARRAENSRAQAARYSPARSADAFERSLAAAGIR